MFGQMSLTHTNRSVVTVRRVIEQLEAPNCDIMEQREAVKKKKVSVLSSDWPAV